MDGVDKNIDLNVDWTAIKKAVRMALLPIKEKIMASKKLNRPLYQTTLRPRPPKLISSEIERLGQRPASPATLIQQARLNPSSLAPANVRQIQRMVGNSATAQLLAPSGQRPQATKSSGGVARGQVVQRMTYAVKHPKDTPKNWEEVQGDAERFNDPPLVYDEDEFKENKEGEEALNIFGHGNQADVGGMTPGRLAIHLLDECEMPGSIRTITLHSCMSGMPDTRRGEPTFGKTYAEQLHAALLKRFQSTSVTGQKGLAFTDSTGTTRVLKPGKDEDKYKRDRDRAEGEDAKRAVEDEYLLPFDESNQTWTAVDEDNPFMETHEKVEENELWKAFQLFPEPPRVFASQLKYERDEELGEPDIPLSPEDMRQRKFWEQL